MAAYYRKTVTVFWQSFTLGTAFSGCWFLFYPNSLDRLIPGWLAIRFVPLFKVVAFFAPALILFLGLYLFNWFLIRMLAAEELGKRQEKIMGRLVDSLVSNEPLPYELDGLIDKHAWKSLKLFWRFK